MKPSQSFVLLTAIVSLMSLRSRAEPDFDAERAANLIILDEMGVKNLRLETVEVLETDFEQTVFAIGRIQAVPSQAAVVSSRISGRVIELNVIPGDRVRQGQDVMRVESLQPGNPPPSVVLKAPIAGLVTESHVRIGEPAEPARELMDIVDLSTIWAVARVPEAEVARLKLGAAARIRVSAAGDETFAGKLVRFGTMADQDAGTLDAIFQIANPRNILRPGMRAEFSIVVSARADVMAVPRTAIQGSPAKRIVFVRDFELANAFLRAPVELGEQNDEFVEIVNGLFPGDDVVTRGSYGLAFAGGSGISLKEALDAAHGHEHAEDGSELTPEQRAERAAKAAGAVAGQNRGFGAVNAGILAYALVATLVALVLGQNVLNRRKSVG